MYLLIPETCRTTVVQQMETTVRNCEVCEQAWQWGGFAIQVTVVCSDGSFFLQSVKLSTPIKSGWCAGQDLWWLFGEGKKKKKRWFVLENMWNPSFWMYFILIGDVRILKFRLSVSLVYFISELFSSC